MINVFNAKLIKYYLVISFSLLTLFYIFQAGALAQQEYLVRDHERKLNALYENNRFLDIGFSQKNSLSNIENYLFDQNFVKADQVKYIQILQGTVVSK